MATVNRRFNISETSEETLTTLEKDTGMDAGEIVSAAIEALAVAGLDVLADEIVKQAQTRAKFLKATQAKRQKTGGS